MSLENYILFHLIQIYYSNLKKIVAKKNFELPSNRSKGYNSESVSYLLKSVFNTEYIASKTITVELLLICETNEFLKYVVKEIQKLIYEMF